MANAAEVFPTGQEYDNLATQKPKRVQVDNGAFLEFPFDAGDAEIDAGVKKYLSEQPPPEAAPTAPKLTDIVPEQKGFFGRMGDNLKTRAGNIMSTDIVGQNPLESAVQIGGEGLGVLADALVEGIGVAGEAVTDYSKLHRRKLGIPEPKEETAPPESALGKGFFGRMGDNLKTRAGNIMSTDIAGQNPLESAVQIGGEGLGVLGDALVEGIGVAGEAVTDYGKLHRRKLGIPEPKEETAPPESALGKGWFATKMAAEEGITQGVEAVDEFAQEYPRAYKNIKGVVNIGLNAPLVKPFAKALGMGGEALAGGGKALAGGGKAIGEAMKSPPLNTLDDIIADSKVAYKTASEQGGVWKPQLSDKFLDSIAADSKVAKQTDLGRALVGDNEVTKIREIFEKHRGKSLDFDSLDEADRILTQKITDNVLKNKGQMDSEGLGLAEIQNSLRQTIDNAAESDVIGGKSGFNSAKEGRRLWRKQAQLRDIESIIQRAELTVNPATAIKTGFRNLFMNPARMYGYDDATKAMIKKVADSGLTADILRTLGSPLISIIRMGAGGSIGGTAAVSAANIAAKGFSSRAAIGRAQKVADKIAGKKTLATKVTAPSSPTIAPSSPRLKTTIPKRNP